MEHPRPPKRGLPKFSTQPKFFMRFTQPKFLIFPPQKTITPVRLKKTWPTKPRKTKFLTQNFSYFPEKTNPTKIFYTFYSTKVC